MDSSYLSWWLSGLALAATMLTHWVVSRRMMAVSGRFTDVINRLRYGDDEPEPTAPLSERELLEALRAATEAEFGADSVDAPPSPPTDAAPEPTREEAPRTAPFTLVHHALFFGALVVGGALAASLRGARTFTFSLGGEGFAALSGGQPVVAVALLAVGGLLVGFGTRMAGGCTSGHGLCGVSRLQPGSLAATGAFFAAGIVTAFLLGALS
jgi:hypothetical protein